MSNFKRLIMSSSPFLHSGETTPRIMFEVAATLLLPVMAAIAFFGMSAFLVIITSVISCLFTEWLFDPNKDGKSLKDGSALVTGLLLALTLPPAIPLWMVFIGGFTAISLGKVIFGGLGQNIFNPALVGRAFLQSAFPTAITTFCAPNLLKGFAVHGSTFALPFMKPSAAAMTDAISSATPLSLWKYSSEATPLKALFTGATAGSLGETSAFFLLICGFYLLLRKLIDWRIPLSIILSTLLFSSAFYLSNPAKFASPLFMLLSGGFLLGTFYMATDLVTSPVTPKGQWIYGIGIGFLIVIIRYFGGLPEGVMYAILLMNAITPLIRRISGKRVYGTGQKQ
jgi:electron transport complex protein RnfD